MDNLFNFCINEEDIIKISEYFHKPSLHSDKNVKIELHLYNYATKSDFKSNRCWCSYFSSKIKMYLV